MRKPQPQEKVEKLLDEFFPLIEGSSEFGGVNALQMRKREQFKKALNTLQDNGLRKAAEEFAEHLERRKKSLASTDGERFIFDFCIKSLKRNVLEKAVNQNK